MSAAKPITLAVIAENIPRRLATGKRFVLWRWELREGKWTKPPYQPNGQLASVDDPYTWSTFAVALDAYATGEFDGIGRMAEDGIVGIDQDHCVDAKTGEIGQQERARVDLLDSYTEVSPSGTGLRTFVFANLPAGGRRKGNIELYDSGRYLTLTGQRVNGSRTGVLERQAQILKLHRQVFGISSNGQATHKRIQPQPGPQTAYEILQLARDDKNAAKWDRLMRGDTSEYDGDDSRADGALCGLAAFYTDDAGVVDQIVRMSGLYRQKWERADYRERTIAGAIAKNTERYSPPSQSKVRHSDPDGAGDTIPIPNDDTVGASTGWEPADLRPYLTGDRPPRPAPSMLQRSDGINLLYDGKLHWISGEPEGLKSWLAQIAVADAIMLGLVALYVDFEADAESVIDRLIALGCTPEAILAHLSYHRPEVGVGHHARETADLLLAAARARRPAISVIDGVQASMGLDALDSNSARDFYHWWGSFGRALLRLTSGPTIAVDHVVKFREDRKQYAAGTGQKQAAVDVHIGTEILEPFGVGLTGRAALTLQKDRPGMLQQHAGKRIDGRAPLATLTMQSFGEQGGIRFALEPHDGRVGGFRPTVYMERVSRYVELAGAPLYLSAIEKAVPGKAQYVRQAVAVLASEGYLRPTPGRVVAGTATATYISVREYREAADPLKLDDRGTVLRTAGEVVV